MTYFIFNPQTNSLDDSDHPTPIRKNLGEKLLAKKDDNIYPWGYDKNPPWAYIPKDPFDPSIHERFLEDFDIRNETMHADGGRVGLANGTKAPAAIKIDQANPGFTRDQLRKLYKAAGLTIEGKILKRKRPFMSPHGKNTGLSQEMIEKVKVVLDDPINYPTKEKMMKALGYRTDPRPGRTFGMGSFDRLLDEYEKATGTKINRVERFPTSFRYKGSEISKQIGDAAEAMLVQGNDVNVKQLARVHLKDRFLKDPDGARQEIRRILATEGIDIDEVGRMNVKGDKANIPHKRRLNKIKYAAKMAGKEYAVIANSLIEDVRDLNNYYKELAKTNPDAILKNKKLVDALTVQFDIDTGKVVRPKVSNEEILRRVSKGIFELEHIRPVSDMEFGTSKAGKQYVTKGVNIGYPNNLQITTRNMNGQFFNNVRLYMARNNLDKMPVDAETVFKNQNLRTNINGIMHGAQSNNVGWDSKTKTSPIFKNNLNALDLDPNPKLFGDKFLKKAGNVIKPVAKYAGKVALKVLGTVIPPLSTASVGLGLYDMNRARAEGLNRPQELGTAYYLGPEAAQGMRNITDYDYKDRVGKEWENIKESWSAGPTGVTEDISEQVEFAKGGPVIPRVGYRDGPTLGDARGWENMLDLSDPDVVAKLEAKKVLDEQKYAENRNKAHENRFLHRTDDYYTSQDESFIPHYVQDVAKTTFGTQEGRQYFGSKLAEGAIEGTEWLVMQIPHLLSKVNPVGLIKLQKEMEEGNFSWMDLLYEPKLGEKWGMNKYQQAKLEELREQAEAEGKPGIPQGVETLGTAGELGAMFADPFVMYGAYKKLAPHLKTKKRGIEEQVDEGRRDFTKLVGGGGLMVALAKIFPGIFKDTKALKAAGTAKKVGQTVKQFGNVRGMPDWFPSFMLKATQKGKLKSLPDKDYIEPMVYELMLPVKKRYYTSTSKDRGIGKLDDNPITSRGPQDHWGSKASKMEIRVEKVPVRVTQNPNTGEMTVSWTGTDNFGDDIERSINYKPGETGTQNYAADEYGRGTSKEDVVIQEPEFEYVEPDYTSMGPEDTSPDSASYLDIHDEADEIVEAMEEFVKGADDKFKKKAADEFRLYNQTDEHFGDATGHQGHDGDWVAHEDNLPFPTYDKEVKDVYHPKWRRKKKAMGGVASGPPPLSGPVPQGLPSLQPGDIYNEWIR